MGKSSSNDQDVASLQGEGGSDVFTTTRHINYNQPQVNFILETININGNKCKILALRTVCFSENAMIVFFSPRTPKAIN